MFENLKLDTFNPGQSSVPRFGEFNLPFLQQNTWKPLTLPKLNPEDYTYKPAIKPLNERLGEYVSQVAPAGSMPSGVVASPDPNNLQGEMVPQFQPQPQNKYSYGKGILQGLFSATPNLINGLLATVAAKNDADLQKQMITPTVVGPRLVAPQVNYGASKARLASNAARVRSNAAQQTTSDATQNAAIRAMGEDQARQYEEQIGQVQEKEVNTNTQAAAEIANKQAQIDANVANQNSQQHAAAFNNVINAERAYNQSKFGNLIQTIDATADTITSRLHDYNAEALAQQKNQDATQYYNQMLALQQQYNDSLSLDNFQNDFGEGAQYDFGNGIKSSFAGNLSWADVQKQLTGDIQRYNSLHPNSQLTIESVLGTDKGKELYKTFTDLQAARQKGLGQQSNILTLQQQTKYYPTIINSLPMQNFQTTPAYLPMHFKQGGKTPRDRELDRWVRLAMLHQKKQQAEKEQTLKAQQIQSRNLNEALKRLSAEEQILLRSVFK